jgi:hypothetical protein
VATHRAPNLGRTHHDEAFRQTRSLQRTEGGDGEKAHVAAALSAEPEVVVPGHVEDGPEPLPEHGHGAREVVPRLGDVARHDERVLLPSPRADLGGEPAHPLHVVLVVGVEVGHDEHARGRRGRAAPDAAGRAQRPAVVRRVEQVVVGGGGHGQMRRHVERGMERRYRSLPLSKNRFSPFPPSVPARRDSSEIFFSNERERQLGDFDGSRWSWPGPVLSLSLSRPVHHGGEMRCAGEVFDSVGGSRGAAPGRDFSNPGGHQRRVNHWPPLVSPTKHRIVARNQRVANGWQALPWRTHERAPTACCRPALHGVLIDVECVPNLARL